MGSPLEFRPMGGRLRRAVFVTRAAVVLAGFLAVPAPGPAAGGNPQTPLPIDLVGVIVNRNSPEKSVCLLRSSSSSAETVLARPGDTVFRVAVVQAIDTESVLLKNLATDEVENLGFWKTRITAPAFSIRATPPSAAATGPPLEMPKEIIVPKSIVDHYRANLKEIMDSASFAPHFRIEGARRVMDGFEIGSVKGGAIADRLGFRAGDVILEANGTRFDSLENALALFQKSQNATRVDLIVLRNGQKLTMSFLQK